MAVTAEPKSERLKYGRTQGFEINSRGFALAGPKYYARFRDACRQMIEKYGVNYFKFDGIGGGNWTTRRLTRRRTWPTSPR